MCKRIDGTPLSKAVRCSLFLLFILLNACSTAHKDGPPSFYVDESKVPDAVPKNEPLSKSGNMKSYNVFGQRYYVMRSSKHYEENGVASWYGTQFHSHHTSSGERYDMLAMTAAHKTLPLPTYVQVTNLTNGRKIIVKVNDRGPFEANRIIDLSYVAAKKLGMLGHGTAKVNIKAIDPNDLTQYADNTPKASNPHHNTPKATHAGRAALFIQVGAFRDRMHAERLKQRLSSLVSTPVKINNAKHLYCVQVGPITDMATADLISQRLKANGLRSDRIKQTNFDIT